MKEKTILFIATFLVIGAIVNGQTIAKPDSVVANEKARSQQENIESFLAKKATYPKEGIMNSIQGDVVISFLITKDGKLDSISIVSSPDIALSASSIVAFNEVGYDWIPARINNVPVDKRYLLVFRYRIYLDRQPTDYKMMANKCLESQKYEKALKVYKRGIKDNPYDHQLFELRAKVKEMLGDMEGAKLDRSLSTDLKDKIMNIVDVTAKGFTRIVKTVSVTTRDY